MFKLLSVIGAELSLFKGKEYFLEALKTISETPANPHLGCWIYQIYFLLLLSCIQSISHLFIDQKSTMLLTFNYVSWNNFPNNINLFRVLATVCVVLFYNFTYFRFGKLQHFSFLYNALVENNRTFIMGSRLNLWRIILTEIRFYQVVVMLMELWMICGYIQFCRALSQSEFDSIPCFILAYISMTLSFLVFCIPFLQVSIGGLTGSIGLASVISIFARIKILSKRLLRPPVGRHTAGRLLAYRRLNVTTFQGITEIGTMYSPLLSMFLVTNIGMNCSLLSFMFHNQDLINLYAKFATLALCCAQISVVTFFHVLPSMLTKRLHAPYKRVHSLFVQYRPLCSVTHLRMANNILAFQSKPYGISYKVFSLSFGLITMLSFVKFLLLYTEFFMYWSSFYMKHSHSRK